MDQEQMVSAVLQAVQALPQDRQPLIVALDGRCASGNAVQYRRFYLHKFAAIQIAADFPNDLRAFFKYAAYLRINDQINIALAVTRVQIPQAMALLRKRLERFGQERNFFCFYGIKHWFPVT